MLNKIVIILPNLSGGGAERVNLTLSNEFIKRGYRVEFVLLKARGELIKEVPQKGTVVNLDVERYQSLFWPLLKYLKREKPDAVLAAMWPLSVISIWAAKLIDSNIQVVVSEHTTFSLSPVYQKGFNRFFMPLTMRISYPFSDYVIGVSKGVVRDLKELSRKNFKNMYPIYNPAAPQKELIDNISIDYSYWNSKKSFKIIAIGNLKIEKDYPTLIEAFSILKAKINAELLILGEGSERDLLEKLLEKKGLVESVHLPGFLSNPLAFLKSSDLFVLSSIMEGLPTVLIEALACGIPVVSTDCKSGPREILENGKYGKLVPVSDSRALAGAVLQSLGVKYDKEMLKARAQDFSIEKIADQYLKLLFPDPPKE